MFAFYDFETTGTSPKYDQPIQFAAILTDDDLTQVERINIRCRLAPHIIPAPWAMAVTGVTPEVLTDGTLPTWFEFTQSLREIIRRWAPATWTGYNSLAFDEQFFRQSFFQCLQPNFYETQFNGNQRLDVMKVVFSCWELARDVLEWPLDDQGRQSFKLDRLAPANGFTQHDAHDALGDVEATIHIVRRIKEGAPEVWAQCLANGLKHHVNALLETGQPLRLIERFGARPPRSYFCCFCRRNPDNPNSVGFYDLDGGEPAVMMEGADDALMAAVTASPKRIRTIAVNNVPSLFEKEPMDPLHEERAAMISSRPDFHIRVGQALAGRYADAERSEHVEDQIPDGYGWQSLREKRGAELEVHYVDLLRTLGPRPWMLGQIFTKSQNKIQDPAKLYSLINMVDGTGWVTMGADVKGDIYEGLLERNAEDTKSGAGQYFTPRSLIRAMVDCVRPEPGKTIADPACGIRSQRRIPPRSNRPKPQTPCEARAYVKA